MEDVETPAENRLKMADRCDACGISSQAFVIAEKDGKDLMFCNHHFRRYEDQLVLQGFSIWNESHRINEAPSPSTAPEEFAETVY